MSSAIRSLISPGSVCLPGEAVADASAGATVVVGRGLRQRAVAAAASSSATIESTVGGVVRADRVALDDGAAAPLLHVQQSAGARRYAPSVGDPVIGVVIRVNTSNYVVHIGAAYPATLDALAFDGASKVNRPRLVVGDLIYCRVSVAEPDVETELSCCAIGDMPRKDWATGEAIFGPLAKTGASVVVPLSHAAALIANSCPVLLVAGSRLGFEAVIGLNGRVWLRVDEHATRKSLVALTRCVLESMDCVTPDEVDALVDRYFPPPATVDTQATLADSIPTPPPAGVHLE
jgi:exosome complex component RRP40